LPGAVGWPGQAGQGPSRGKLDAVELRDGGGTRPGKHLSDTGTSSHGTGVCPVLRALLGWRVSRPWLSYRRMAGGAVTRGTNTTGETAILLDPVVDDPHPFV
jgi:hypothetical protein